jgi:hypothetical protein
MLFFADEKTACSITTVVAPLNTLIIVFAPRPLDENPK